MWAKIKKFISQNRQNIFIGIGTATLAFLTYEYYFQKNIDIKLSAFLKALKNNHVEKVIFQGKDIAFKGATQQMYHTHLGDFPITEVLDLLSDKVIFQMKKPDMSKQVMILGAELIMSALTIRYMVQLSKNPSPSNFNIEPKLYENSLTFDHFYGGDIIKTKLRQIINFLKQPQTFKRLGARIRRGVLLYGPPGTGKTMLARALANQSKCDFIKVAASEFQELFAGVGAKRVRELFKNARQCQNGCIIFIDEIDALGSRMNSLQDSHETTATITQFLSEMDGFSPLDKVVVIASTNRLDLVDAAVLRAGRFDIKIPISLPSREERIGILHTLIAKNLKNSDINEQTIKIVAEELEGCCGADLEALLNESIYKAINEQSRVVKSSHVQAALKELLRR